MIGPRTLTAVLALALGCNAGTIAMERLPYDGGADSGSTMDEDAMVIEEMAARDLFDSTVLPLLESNCVSCHGESGSVVGYRFLTPDPDIYTSVTSWPALVSRANPTSSRILTLDSTHPGPEWSTTQADTVQRWLEREGEEYAGSGEEPDLITDAKVLEAGLNLFPLDVLGLPGSQLSLTAEPTPAGWYLSNIEVNAGADGVRMSHPVIIQWVDGDATVDPSDRFAGMDVVAPAYTRVAVGGGTASLSGLPDGASISWHFDAAGPESGGTGGGDGGVGGGDAGMGTTTGGCTALPSFTANVRPQLMMYCTSCHDGSNPDAMSAVDMSNVADSSDSAQALACGQILSRSRGATPSILLAPDSTGGLAHPFRLSSFQLATFSAAITDWVAMEAP